MKDSCNSCNIFTFYALIIVRDDRFICGRTSIKRLDDKYMLTSTFIL